MLKVPNPQDTPESTTVKYSVSSISLINAPLNQQSRHIIKHSEISIFFVARRRLIDKQDFKSVIGDN
jgi:hypothetical protein